MRFFSNFFKKNNKVYLTDIQYKKDKLSKSINDHIMTYKKQFDDMKINYLYIIRMIYYIEENYDINDENIQENIHEYINKDCILLEILINLPQEPSIPGAYASYINMFYKNAKIGITSNMNENKGLLWQILKKKYDSNNNIYEIVYNLINESNNLIELDENTTYTGGIIKIYIDLITMYIDGNISNIIVERLNKIYRGLLMKLAFHMKIPIGKSNIDDTQLIVTYHDMKKLNLGTLYIGYNPINSNVFNDTVKKSILDMEAYEQSDIMKLYTYLHYNIKQIEKTNLDS